MRVLTDEEERTDVLRCGRVANIHLHKLRSAKFTRKRGVRLVPHNEQISRPPIPWVIGQRLAGYENRRGSVRYSNDGQIHRVAYECVTPVHCDVQGKDR